MATLTHEWISRDQARAWLETYDPSWLSEEIAGELAREMASGRRPRWGRALMIDARTETCVEGLHILLDLVRRDRPAVRWVARASDFVFAVSHLEPMRDGRQRLVTRYEDSVVTHPLRMTQGKGDTWLIDPR